MLEGGSGLVNAQWILLFLPVYFGALSTPFLLVYVYSKKYGVPVFLLFVQGTISVVQSTAFISVLTLVTHEVPLPLWTP